MMAAPFVSQQDQVVVKKNNTPEALKGSGISLASDQFETLLANLPDIA